MLAIGLLVWFQPWVPRAIPAEIVGVWFTDDPAYKDRALEIQAQALVFRGGETGPQAVRRVHRDARGALIRYQIDYDSDGGPATLSFTYAPDPDVITLESRPRMLWRRFAR